MSLQERRTRVNNEPERTTEPARTTNLRGRRTCEDNEPARTTNPRGRRTCKDDNPTRARPPRNGTLLSDARRVRFGEKISSEAVKGRLLLILILIISARAQNVKESGFEFCNFTISSMQTTLWSGCGCDGRCAAIGDIFVCGEGARERTALEPSSEAGRLNGKERRRVMLCAQADSGVLFTQTSNHF